MPRSSVLALVAALSAAALFAPDAGAVTFGADLGAPVNNTVTCGSAFGTSSCTMYSGAPGPAFYAPAGGTVTTVRVKTGDFAQGPMQIVVLRSLYQNHAGDPGHPYFACCFVEQYGPTFTPNRNGVTAVPTSLPMVEDPTPPPDDTTTNARGDFLALSVLAGNVPIPANIDNSSGYAFYAPAPNPQSTPAPSPNPIFATTDGFGSHVMMNADLDTGGGGAGGGGGGGGAGGGGAGDVRPLTFPTGGQLLGTTAAVPLACALATACNGRVELSDGAVVLRIAAKKAKKPKVYGSSSFSIPAGKTKSVKVKLNAAGRKRLGRHKSLSLTVTAKVGSHTVSSRVTFKHKGK